MDQNEKERRHRAQIRAAEILNQRFAPRLLVPRALTSAKFGVERVPTPHVARENGRSARVVGSLPPTLYKYMRREHALNLIERGSIRIGTLHDFRDEERHGIGIGDAREGNKVAMIRPDPQVVSAGSEMARQLEAMGGIRLGPGSSVRFVGSGNIIVGHLDHPDAYVWCCSTDFSANTMKDLGKADTCVEIFDTKGFFNALDRAVAQAVDCRRLGPQRVIYSAATLDWNGVDPEAHPVFHKDPQFAVQAEVRIAWKPTTPGAKLAALVLASSDVGKFCRIVDEPD